MKCLRIKNIFSHRVQLIRFIFLFAITPLWAQTFSQVEKIIASDNDNYNYFGWSVSISGDYAIIGARGNDTDAAGLNSKSYAGAAYILEKDSETGLWSEVQKLVASDRDIQDSFGISVSISGNYAIVGAGNEDEDEIGSNSLLESGAAYIYKRGETGNWSEVQKLVASDREDGDQFGFSVSISDNYAIIGAHSEDDDTSGLNNLSDAGSAYIFERDEISDTWSEVQKVVASDRFEGDVFGWSVSVSGNNAVIGARNEKEDEDGQNSLAGAGSVYLFERNVNIGVWSEVQKITSSDRATGDQFGSSVSISEEYALIGAWNKEQNGVSAGSAYIVKKDNSTGLWNEEQILISSDIAGYDQFGSSVSISGNRAMVGAIEESEDADGLNTVSGAGSAYLFERNMDGSWSETVKLVASDRTNQDAFGTVAIDGNHAIIGARDKSIRHTGATYIFKETELPPNTATDILTFALSGQSESAIIDSDLHTVDITVVYGTDVSSLMPTITLADGATISPFSGTPQDFTNPVTYTVTAEDETTSQDWVATVSQAPAPQINQIGEDMDGEAEFDTSGGSISLSNDGSTVAIGAVENDAVGTQAGHVRVFKNQNNVWTQIGQDIDGEDSGDRSGYSVSLSHDGTVLAIGAVSNSPAGHVRVYHLVDNSWVQLGSDIDGVKVSEFFGHSVSLNYDGTILAVGAPYNSSQAVHAGLVRVFQFDGSDWIQKGDEMLSYTSQDYFGYSVSINSSGSILAIGAQRGEDQLTNSGYVKIFEFDSDSWTQAGSTIYGENTGEYFGSSIAINAIGNTVAAGAPLNDLNGNNAGLARVYRIENSEWSKIGSDLLGEDSEDQYGTSVSLDNSGKVLAIGGIFNDGSLTNAGHARIFQNINDSWTKLGTDIDGEGVNDESGTSISLSGSGTVFSVGAPGNRSVNGLLSGHVRVYEIPVSISLSQENDILSFSFPEQTVGALIDTDNHTVEMELAYGSDLTSLTPSITLSNGAALSPISGGLQDFTNFVTYTVTAEDGITSQEWIVEANIDAHTWTGNFDNNWFEVNNWDKGTLPQPSDNVIILSSVNNPVIEGNVSINNLTINEEVFLTVNSGSSLAVFGDVIGEAVIKRNTTGNKGYSIIGSMVHGMTVDDVAADFFYSFNGDVFQRPENTEILEAGKGYFAAFNDPVPSISFNGSLNFGIQNYALPSADKFHLVANPYAAAISHDALVSANTSFDGTIYLWDDGGSNSDGVRDGGYVTVNAAGLATGTGGLQGKDAFNGKIGSGQGFFIYADEASKITFTPSMQSISAGDNSDDAYYRISQPEFIRLSLSNEIFKDDLIIAFDENGTIGFDDRLDSRKLMNPNLSIYSKIDETNLAIQTISNKVSKTTKIPISFESTELGDFFLNIEECNAVPSDLIVYLEDASTKDIYQLADYCQLPISLNSTQSKARFNLIIEKRDVLSLEEKKSKLMIFGTPKKLNIYLPNVSGSEKVIIYDHIGRKVYSEYLHFVDGKSTLNTELKEQVIYVLQAGNQKVKFNLKKQ